MSTVILGIVLSAVTIIMASYGAVYNVSRLQATGQRQLLDAGFERMLTHVSDVRRQLGRLPVASELDATALGREGRVGVVFSYGTTSSYGYVCAVVAAYSHPQLLAFLDLARQRGVVLGNGTCDDVSGAGSKAVSMTIRVMP